MLSLASTVISFGEDYHLTASKPGHDPLLFTVLLFLVTSLACCLFLIVCTLFHIVSSPLLLINTTHLSRDLCVSRGLSPIILVIRNVFRFLSHSLLPEDFHIHALSSLHHILTGKLSKTSPSNRFSSFPDQSASTPHTPSIAELDKQRAGRIADLW